MRRNDRDDPFGEFFREFERFLDDVLGESGTVRFESVADMGQQTHIDIYEEDDALRVVADLPGVEKSDIEVSCDGQRMTITASSERRNYDERVRLPQRVDETAAQASYNNGVLEVRFPRSDGGESINID